MFLSCSERLLRRSVFAEAKNVRVVFAVKGVAQCATPYSAAKVYHGMTVLSRNTLLFLEAAAKAILQGLITLKCKETEQQRHVHTSECDQADHGHNSAGDDR